MSTIDLTTPKAFCFVLMPFSDEFSDVYQIGIKEACENVGLYCERVDEQIFQERILDRIYNQISKADFIVADMSGRNANVFYEVGYAHALGKPTILLTSKSDDIPFDLKHFPHIIYDNKISKVRDELTKRLSWFIKNEDKASTGGKIDLDLYIGEENLSAGNVSFLVPNGEFITPTLTLHNTSPKTFESGYFRIGVITSSIDYCQNQNVRTTKLPNGLTLYMFSEFDALFPDEFTSLWMGLVADRKFVGRSLEEDIVLRVYTDLGTRDFPLKIGWQ